MFKVQWFSKDGKVVSAVFKEEWEAVELARDLYRDFLIPSDVIKI